MKRREVFEKILLFPVFGVFAQTFLMSCNASVTSSTGAACTTVGASVGVGTDHGHSVAVVPWADIDLAIQQTYTVAAGSSGHIHTFTISALNMATMKAGNSVVVTTTDADGTGHSHTITVTCSH